MKGKAHTSKGLRVRTWQVKELQARYANNPEAANQAVQQLYQTENVNPLAGCLPAIAQIPIFISLYRWVLAFLHQYMEYALSRNTEAERETGLCFSHSAVAKTSSTVCGQLVVV